MGATLDQDEEHEAIAAQPEPLAKQVRPMGLRSGFDPTGFNRLADDLEAEALLETTRKLMERSR